MSVSKGRAHAEAELQPLEANVIGTPPGGQKFSRLRSPCDIRKEKAARLPVRIVPLLSTPNGLVAGIG